MEKNIIKYIKILNTFIFLIIFIFILSLFDKGFDYTDESYYILSSKYPTKVENFVTYFHFITAFIFKISFENLLNFRVLGLLILIFSAAFFSTHFLKFSLLKKIDDHYFFYFKIVGIVSIIFYYLENLFTPSYNLLNLSLILLISGAIFRSFLTDKESRITFLTISFLYFLLCINKITAGIIMSPFIVFFLFYKFSKTKLITFLLSFVIFSAILFFDRNISFVNDYFTSLFLSSSQEIKNLKYLKIDITIFNIVDVYKRLINYEYKNYYFIATLISLVLRYNLNTLIVILILFENFLTFSASIIWHDFFYLLVYNFICFCFLRKDFYKNNFIYLSLLVWLSFAYYYGTNVELVRFLNQSSIFNFIGLVFLFLNNYNFKFKEILINILVILVLNCGFNAKKSIEKKEYLVSQSLQQNIQQFQSKYNKKLFKNIKIRKKLKDFNIDFENILSQNNWTPGSILLDATLKHPGMLLVADGRFIETPWYFHKKEYLSLSLDKISQNDHPWFIVDQYDEKIKKIIFNKFNYLEFKRVGLINHPYSKRNIEIFKPLE